MQQQKFNQQLTVESPQLKSEQVYVHDPVLPWTSLSFAISGAAIFVMLTKVLQDRQNKKIENVNPDQHIPCINCQFFANNAHLKCAVHPYIVLTEKALNCFDYRPKNDKMV